METKSRFNAYGEKIKTQEEIRQEMKDMRKRLLKRSLIRSFVILGAVALYLWFTR